MVHVIREKNLFELAKQSAREIGVKTLAAYGFMAVFFLAIATTFILSQTRQTVVQNATYDATTRTFTETFDGDPPSPQPFTQINQNNWDVQVHRRDRPYNEFDPMEAMHGMNCSAPPASHTTNGTYADAVFNCKNHLMTAINEGGYGVIYLTPNAMLDFANGGIIQFELSTFRSSNRDWWDITVSPFDDAQALPLLSDLSQGTDLQEPNKNSIVITTDNGEGSPNIKLVRNGVITAYGNPFFNMSEGITPGTNEMATRQTFKLTVTKTHIRFERLASSTATALLITEKDIPELSWSKGVVQFGHHSYNPSKACAYDGTCGPNTWHWDTVNINPATPFSIIKTDKEFVDNDNTTVTFNTPAPANAYLRFAGICKVKVDGLLAAKMTYTGHPEHFSSYMVPIAQGKQNAVITFANDDWYETGQGCAAKDFAIWSTTVSSSSNPTATPTVTSPTNTPTPIPNATNTPTPIPPTPTKTPAPTQTPIPTNTPVPTSTPTPQPTATTAPQKTGDITGDNKIDIQDLSYLLSHWNSTDQLADLNHDGKVNTLDLSMLLSNWGK